MNSVSHFRSRSRTAADKGSVALSVTMTGKRQDYQIVLYSSGQRPLGCAPDLAAKQYARSSPMKLEDRDLFSAKQISRQ